MKANDKIDAARVDLLLGELRPPGIKLIWTALARGRFPLLGRGQDA
jgi:hypothetical protein